MTANIKNDRPEVYDRRDEGCDAGDVHALLLLLLMPAGIFDQRRFSSEETRMSRVCVNNADTRTRSCSREETKEGTLLVWINVCVCDFQIETS